MKKLALTVLALLPLVAVATVQDFENDPKTCYVFEKGRLIHKTACYATGTMGGGINYTINEVAYTSGAFGRIAIVNNVTNNDKTFTTINNQSATTQYRHPSNYQIVPINNVNAYLNRGEVLLQCIKSRDERLEICTTDLLQI